MDNPFQDLAFDPVLPLASHPQLIYAAPVPECSVSRSSSAVDSSTGDDTGSSAEESRTKRQPLKRERRELEMPAEGMAATLPKEVELELESLEEFEEYVTRLKKTRALNAGVLRALVAVLAFDRGVAAEAAAIQKQRKVPGCCALALCAHGHTQTIRNRLYAKQKRIKDRKVCARARAWQG